MPTPRTRSLLLHHFVDVSAARTPHNTALIAADRRITYAELSRVSDRLAARFVASGVAPGDAVVIATAGPFEIALSTLAAWKAGATPTVLGDVSAPERVLNRLHRTDASLLVCADDLLFSLAPADPWEKLPRLKSVFALGTDRPADKIAPSVEPFFEEWSASGVERESEQSVLPRGIDQELAALVEVPGSGEQPLLAMHSHRGLRTLAESLAERLELSNDQIVLGAFPASSAEGLLVMLAAFQRGATLVCPPAPELPGSACSAWRGQSVSDLWWCLLREGVTVGLFPPRVWDDLAVRSEEERRSHFMSRIALVGGVWTPARRRRTAADTETLHLDSFWSRAECPLALGGSGLIEAGEFAGSAENYGEPLPNLAAFVADEKGEPLPHGRVGALTLRGSGLFTGYWKNLTVTRERLKLGRRLDDWQWQTGDAFRFDADRNAHPVQIGEEDARSDHGAEPEAVAQDVLPLQTP